MNSVTSDIELKWESLVSEIKNCKKCRLYRYRKNPVPGEGPLNAKLMLIGEAPGSQEDEMGRPFVGAAGRLLTELLERNGISRSKVFIGNLIKCRPPNNRDPLPDEIEKCSPYLIKQIELIRPKTIVCLGRYSSKYILGILNVPFTSISKVRGKVFRGNIGGLNVEVFVTYHPAVALYKPKYRGLLEEDFKTIARLYRGVALDRGDNKLTLDYFFKKYRVG